jgi:hypothetical protein
MNSQHKLGGFGRRYFSRPPLRSYHFGVSTIFVLVVASQAAFYLVHFRLLFVGEAGAYVILSVVVILFIWFKILRSHQSVYDAYRGAGEERLTQDPVADTLLDNLAYLSYAGFGLALFAVGSVYTALAWVLAVSKHR